MVKAKEKPPAKVAAKPAAEDTRRLATRMQASVLKAALGDVMAAVESRNTIPILAYVLIEAGNGTIIISGTNLDIWAWRSAATADRDGPGSADWISSIQPFSATVPAKPLAGILAELDGEAMVTLEFLDGEKGTGGRMAVSAGRARFLLHSLPPVDFPAPAPLVAEHCFEVPCSALADALARVEYAISTEEVRYYLNGIFMHLTQNEGEPQWLVFAATDGHRLARLRLEVPEGAASFPAAIISRATVAMMDKLLRTAAKAAEKVEGDAPAPTVQIEASEGGASFCFTLDMADGGEIVVQAKAIDGEFPDYTRVIPRAPEHHATVDRDALAAAVKRVGVICSDKTRAVTLAFSEDTIALLVTALELGEAREEVPCVYSGPDLAIGFNGAFLRESLLSLATDEVKLSLNGPGDPMLLLAGGADAANSALVQVIMPMRV